MTSKHFPQNLRYLCSYHRSISSICREVGLNRQQFNKYLSGISEPSSRNLRRICDFFGVEQAYMSLPHLDFVAYLKARAYSAEPQPEPRSVMALVSAAFPSPGPALRRYAGYYHSHFYSLGYPGNIIRSLICFYERDSRMCSKSIERLPDDSRRRKRGYITKYDGLVAYISDRIFVVEREALLGNAVASTILYPTYRSHVTVLSGLTFGVPTRKPRHPACTRVIYEYLGRDVDRRAALAACGLFAADSAAVDDEIKAHLASPVEAGDHVLRAVEL